MVEDNFQKLSTLRAQLRDLQTEENRRLREEASDRFVDSFLKILIVFYVFLFSGGRRSWRIKRNRKVVWKRSKRI